MTRYPIAAFFLLALLGVFSAGKTAMMWWYHLERSSFEKQFCKNVDRPELNCHGSCHIKALFQDSKPASEMVPSSQVPLPEFSPMEIRELTPVLFSAQWAVRAHQRPFTTPQPIDGGFQSRLLRPPDGA